MKTQTTKQVSTRLMLIAFVCLTAAACRKADELKSANSGEIEKLASTGAVRAASSDLILGINGHPLNSFAYNANGSTVSGITYTQQAEMVSDMGLTYYRVDVATDATGKSTNETKLLDIIAKCQAKGIKILPMIYDICRFSETPAQNYQRAKTQMAGFATKYGHHFDYYELGNEMELFDSLKTKGTRGDQESHYIPEKVERAAQYIRGMEEGLKEGLQLRSLTGKSMVNTAGFFPIYWMDRMFAVAPSIDICAWHVYAEMPGGYNNLNPAVPNIHQYLYNRYGRPIWYTESNYRSDEINTQEENEQEAEDWRIKFTQECLNEPNVQALIYHELLDNPERGTYSKYDYAEENFGYVKFNGYPGKKSGEAAYNTWKSNPNRYQDWSYKLPGATLVGPDLIVTDITWTPSSPAAGNTMTFTAVIKNVGPAPTPGGVIQGVSFKVDGRPAGCNGSSTSSIAPGATRTLTGTACTRWIATAGSHTVVATVDDQFRIREKDETNNTRSETFSVSN